MRNVPKLRFKEFSEEWEEKKLGEIGEFKNGVNKGKDDFGTGYPFINLLDIFGKCSINNNNDLSLVEITSKELKEFNLLKGDVLFVRSSVKPDGVGLTTVILNDLKDTVYSGFIIRFRESKNLISLNYKKYCFYEKQFRKNLLMKSTVSANTNINQDNLKLLSIKLPTIQEQQKIADFLSSVDKKISITEEKLDLFKDYKKGIMQKIFNQELRFKDSNGNDYPEWQEKILGEVSSFINGKGHEQFIDKNGNYIVVNSKFISSDGLIKKYTSNLLVPLYVNDILMVMSDVPNGKAIGKCFLVNENNKYSLNQRICALRTGENSKYLYYFLNRNSYFLKFDDGISQTNLKKDEVLSCPIFLPCLEEQQKIADFLSSIDNKIDNLTAELEDLKEFKKGLLQQMFV